MKAGDWSTRLFDALASLRLAVTVMVSLALTCLSATLYESKHGTAAAQREFYQTGWFAFILATLGANIFCAMMKRYPWKPHHTGFVMAHIGILSLLAGSLISLNFGLDSNMALYEGETTDRVSLAEHALFVALPGQPAPVRVPGSFERWPPRPGHETKVALSADTSLVTEEFQPHVKVTESFTEGTTPKPVLHFILDAPFAKQDAWLLAADSARSRIDFGPAAVAFQAASSEDEARALVRRAVGRNQISFASVAGKLFYGISTKAGPGADGLVEVGRPVETPWMGMKVVVDRFLERAVMGRTVAPEPPPEKDDRRMPAVRVHLEGPSGRSPSEWLLYTESRELPFAGGVATVAYRTTEAVVPFRVSLLKFNSDKYPGTNMAATYESWVRVDDPERGVSEHHISMNHPLHYRGYIFFQASFVEGEPMMSIFSVARAPGLPLVYVGVVLISSGVIWMFYVKPYLAHRQAARALEAHRERQSRDEAQRAMAVAGGPGPGEPARSRA